MGGLQSRPTPTKQTHKAIDDIYSMFEQSNRVLLDSHSQKLSKSRIKDVNSLLEQLLEPFAENSKYTWGDQIRTKFTQHFSNKFEEIWAINREQFYQLLLTNCNAKGEEVVRQKLKGRTYQKYFYEIAVLEIQQSIVDSFVGPIKEGQRKLDYLNASILQNNGFNLAESEMLPLVIPHQKLKHQLPRQIILTESISSEQTQEDQLSRMRLQSCSLLLPETVFVDRLTATSRSQITDLLKYYKQFTITLQQIFYSNNLLSCPLKNFIFSIEEKLTRKRIRPSGEQEKDLLVGGEQGRRIRKVRQMNNNLLLYEIKYFMEAYTEFVWMYLQLQYMAESRLGKIVNSDILYGVIFKSVWGYVDWIAQRGYEYEENRLEEYFLNESRKEEANVTPEMKQHFTNLLSTIRGEKHPQQYLKKVVVFYRQVSKNCQNADQLLIIYEQTIARLIRQNGGKDLGIFRMKNVIEKLLKIDQNSLSGGEISYSWATWSILIELLRQKVNYKYGGLLISKSTKEFQLSQQDVRSQSNEHLIVQPE